MPAPLAKGLIIAASVLVAAGIALYESPQVRQWVDQSRRKIAIALHSLGDDIQPRRPSESSEDFEYRRKRRESLIRRNRNDLIRRAREEGVAVDLDELAKIGIENFEMAERRSRADSAKSFDDMVGSDGMLRRNAKATGKDTSEGAVRRRGAATSDSTTTPVDPFSDNQVIFGLDDDDDEAPSPKPFTYIEPGTRDSSATLSGDTVSPPAAPELLIDLTSGSVHVQPGSEELGSLTHLDTSETDRATQSFYSFTSSASQAGDTNPPSTHPFFDDNDAEHVSAGTLTPRSEHSIATGASAGDTQVDDIGILSMQNSIHNETDQDARSEVFSEGGFTDAGFSEAGFSELGNADRADRLGVMTPSSWTDVGSDDESEWGGVGGHGHVSQVHQ